MELFIDESGNTGCVITRKSKLNFEKQRHFVLCAITVKNEEDKNQVIKKYQRFKEEFNIKKEIKGSELLTRKRNKELEYFLNQMIDDEHFNICVYDKKFYLASLFLLTLVGNELQKNAPIEFYNLVSLIVLHGEDILIAYCEVAKEPTNDKFDKLLGIIIEHELKDKSELYAIFCDSLKEVKNKKDYKAWIEDIISYGSYENKNYINVINLTCLTELIISIKLKKEINSEKLIINHDNIDGYDKTILSELKDYRCNINFVDSNSNELIQFADNVASIFAKCANQTVNIFASNEQWNPENEWILKVYSKLMEKIKCSNIKYTLSIPDWSVSLCVLNMFNDKFPKSFRNNFHFNYYYIEAIKVINESLLNHNFDLKFALNLLKK